MGSEPVDRMKTRGVFLDMSLYRVARVTAGLSTNCWPRFSATKSTAANTTYMCSVLTLTSQYTEMRDKCKAIYARVSHIFINHF